ncbi:SprT family protein [Fictibacillus aquaticus]|uniref:Protein SprT-like n=1 Tax=Fictibacillus aquaticus TaxID=2021314 RepID=A0A235F4S2_9BACL|nr:SprT family protein [Fictibacillus aquaticus]OYD56259.1 SprT family protein [Fictibacillus aquaticus]
MDQQQLQLLTESISRDFFHKPFRHTARFNSRLKTTGGRYLLRSHDIEINPKQYEIFGEEALVSIIKHELVHYHLHIESRGYKHRDPEFRQLLEEVGGARFCQSLPGAIRKEAYKHLYKCTDCNVSFKRKRRVNTAKYVCGRCRGKLIHIISE